MNQTTPMPAFTTKGVDEVPFKNELYSKDCSFELIQAANRKTYREFVRDCKNPDHLLQVMLLKCNEPHFPSLIQVNRISNRATLLGILVKLFAGQAMANELKCAIYRNNIPKNQYAKTI